MPGIMAPFDWLLDKSIFFSFDQSGYQRHQKSFNQTDLDVDMSGKVCIVTGANSGLGYETAKGLAQRGASVHLLCRNLKRGIDAQNRIRKHTDHQDVHCHQVDISSPRSIEYFVQSFKSAQIDVLVHNAGVLPKERQITPEGHETTVATHITGPYILTERLRPRLFNARVIFVSSGGMYSKRLNVDKMLQNTGRYDGVSAYAMTKRAQVSLTELVAPTFKESGTVVNAMHPGWAATPGVADSLPGFSKLMQRRLRTPKQGADTIIWLAVSEAGAQASGAFWFDRKQVSPYLIPGTQEDLEARTALVELCWAQL